MLAKAGADSTSGAYGVEIETAWDIIQKAIYGKACSLLILWYGSVHLHMDLIIDGSYVTGVM